MRIIEIVEFSEKWCVEYTNELKSIKAILSQEIIKSYHIGSTAIQGMAAKPIIDILLVVKSLNNIDNYNKELFQLGYEAKGEYGLVGRRFFQKGGDNRTHHVHVFEEGNPEIERHVLFVEYLKCHPKKVMQYEKLKKSLEIKYKYKPSKYSLGKSDFIQLIEREAFEWKKSCK